MKFGDGLISNLNGVRMTRLSWPKGKTVTATLRDESGQPYTFTLADDRADDWAVYVPKAEVPHA